jgi:hypothetical protein
MVFLRGMNVFAIKGEFSLTVGILDSRVVFLDKIALNKPSGKGALALLESAGAIPKPCDDV